MYGTSLFPLILLTFHKLNGLVLATVNSQVQSTQVLFTAYASNLCKKNCIFLKTSSSE